MLGLALAGSGCAKNKDTVPSITNIAVTNPNFQLLEDAAIRGGVALVLGNKNPNDPQGNYTVFAPNNDAFNRLGIRQAVDLGVLQPAFLTNTLLYHVYSGSLAGGSSPSRRPCHNCSYADRGRATRCRRAPAA